MWVKLLTEKIKQDAFDTALSDIVGALLNNGC